MKHSKKIFIIVSLLFFVAVLVVSYDISRKTSFPGSKKYLKESIMPSDPEEKPSDSTQVRSKPKENL